MFSIRKSAAIVLSTLVAAGPAYSQPPVTMLKASVSSSSGKPLAGAQMRVVSLDTGRAILAATTSAGVMAAELAPGLYTVSAAAGYEQVSGPRVVSIAAGEVASAALAFRTNELAQGAAQPAITVDVPGCLVAGQFPQVPASVVPADKVVKTRLYFKGGASPEVFFVDMVAGAGGYTGVLPKPTVAASPITVYVEVTGDFGQTRSVEHQIEVVGNAAECKGKPATAAAVGPAAATALLSGAAGVPVGFAGAAAAVAAGTAGGILGLSTATALLVGGAVVAGGAIIVATNGPSSPSK